ncbi:MAG: bifunctional 5,10-methylenetetrahydrofolate dehydrogenase/5,10-methenyltetrahydrofolate cyclohydrolase [Bacteroidetes bacterium]|nr:MAG: bifunctional 5,10-methylenetetrahydrofolate dehydrogenase/5,10-methenyltetrahydrofolate cyclohydrolase [Bacteroidota bacterium]REK00008.1 MAG: bifunctional 5,10-methylenetetrahydrofolate dehydrogenase/5,10-methenyltetrahydrofolate cyclohydrolase [Bacteroidota bacterium]REK35813.1 MAG: bifunctional 5,10-methylenetetrahydrofolate dehydrogenase/5,10-methenyltetrahydrofolate cyclohydrolase [Bacteroidota bacterium]REK49316.1 MAG: bifunctional 5,10-methylenetetrahydrofolate dehydrogenase/5,10-
MILLDGKLVSSFYKKKLAEEVKEMKARGERAPHLCAILVGEDPASETYVASKVKNCAEVGFDSTLIRLDNSVSEAELISRIESVNINSSIDGIIVQLPLPAHISVQRVTESVSPAKDVDGFHPLNIGRMVQNLPSFLPATPLGILLMLEHYKIETAGKHCVVVGRSNIVGTPASILLARNSSPGNCTVTLCHSRTKNLKSITSNADIIIAAIGKPRYITADMVKEGAIVMDVGINRIQSSETKSGWKLVGDVDFEPVSEKCSMITPVPGGLGLMTIIGLLQNTLKAAKKEVQPVL